MKILYIEDSPEHIQTVQRIISYLKHELITAGTAQDGYTLLTRQHPDVILLDISLPDMNGLVLARQIRAAGFSIPIIAITANSIEYDEAQACEAGCNGFIVKPYTAEQLMALLARLTPLQS